ncbi:MAG TPA: ribosomal-processing cysteine protease Prp [Clostridiaceae bacterium]|nr:ribosomal-processing cysteine protease Prp [Clostridiaceae bacterium]
MIEVTIYRQKNGFTNAFRMTGHAGQGEYGQDIICAAVSGLAQSIIGSLQEIVGIEPLYTLEEGKIYCEIEEDVLNKSGRIQADALMRTVEIGARQIQASYGSQFLTVFVITSQEGQND